MSSPRFFFVLIAFFLITESRGEKEGESVLTDIEGFLTKEVNAGKIAGGTVLILHRGEPVYQVAAGYADLDSGRPFRVNDRVVVASISKPLVATALFRLSDAGKLDLELPISQYLPEFSESKLENGKVLERGPTTLELISHSGGALSFYSKGGRPWFASWTREKTLAEVAKVYAAGAFFESIPGTRYAYSGIGTDIVARVGEVAAGQLRNEYFLAEVAGPLGMKDTEFGESGSRSEEMPTRYLKDEKSGKLRKSSPRPMPEAGQYNSSGGAIISTADDLAIWLKMVRDGGRHDDSVFLSPSTMEAFLKPSPLGQTTGGGLHIRRRDEEGGLALIGHSGSSGTDCWIDFENDLIGIVLTQSGSKAAKPLHDKVRVLALKWAGELNQSRPAR